MNHPEQPSTPDAQSRAWTRMVHGELWHQIEIDHEVYHTILQESARGEVNARLRRLLRLDPPLHPSLRSAREPSRAAVQLTVRAESAAEAAAERQDSHRITDPALAHAARAAARVLADLLGVELANVTVRRDERVAPGDPPVLLLTVSDAARHHEFAAPAWQGERILAVLPCPLCAQPVATCLIPDLAAYGTLLATLPLGAIAFDEPHRLLDEVAEEFFTDPGHTPTCRYSPHAEQNGNQDTPNT